MFLQGKILEAVKAKGVPQLYLPAGDDSPDVYPGGIGEKVAKPIAKLRFAFINLFSLNTQVLGDLLSIVEFKDMKHGWTTRGDLSDAKVICHKHAIIIFFLIFSFLF